MKKKMFDYFKLNVTKSFKLNVTKSGFIIRKKDVGDVAQW